MVRFEDTKLVIEIETYTTMNAVDVWMTLCSTLYNLLKNVDSENISDTFYSVPSFLEELMPDWDTLKKMAI